MIVSFSFPIRNASIPNGIKTSVSGLQILGRERFCWKRDELAHPIRRAPTFLAITEVSSESKKQSFQGYLSEKLRIIPPITLIKIPQNTKDRAKFHFYILSITFFLIFRVSFNYISFHNLGNKVFLLNRYCFCLTQNESNYSWI